MKTIGKYEVCGLLGRGGMSAVYKVRLPVAGKIVALKLLDPRPPLRDLLGDREIENRFITESVRMAGLRHPHVADLLDFDFSDGRPFFTMEYYCRNLGALLGEARVVETPSRVLRLDRILHYMKQLLLGLSRMHRAGMVHRDIKPFNLLLTDEDQLKISDFGLSRLRGDATINPSGLAVGSPYYAAPEQERDPEAVDRRADLYSAGVVLYRMLTGLLPEGEPPAPSRSHPDADSIWDRFAFKALDKNRERRFASAEEMLEDLARLKTGWEIRKGETCRLETEENPPERERIVVFRPPLRQRPMKVAPGNAPKAFGCDPLLQPLDYLSNDFEPTARGTAVLDRTTGLLWERKGSEDPIEWADAHHYIESLNGGLFAGYRQWRLPTVDELRSLLRPIAFGGEDCLPDLFDKRGKRLWTSDRKSFTAAWYVDAELGFVGWGDFTCRFFVRAVCSAEA